MSDRTSVSGALAAFASGIRAENIPEDVAHQAVRCLVDWFGCTIAGAATPESGRVRAAIRAMDPDGSRAAGIVGTRERSTAGQAARCETTARRRTIASVDPNRHASGFNVC